VLIGDTSAAFCTLAGDCTSKASDIMRRLSVACRAAINVERNEAFLAR